MANFIFHQSYQGRDGNVACTEKAKMPKEQYCLGDPHFFLLGTVMKYFLSKILFEIKIKTLAQPQFQKSYYKRKQSCGYEYQVW
jgi:hypothetical protein